MMPALLAAAVLLLTSAGTALVRRYALRRQLIDVPGARRSHQVATPRGGGAAIVLVVLAVLLWLAFGRGGFDVVAAGGAAALVLVALVGWIDDHRPLSPWSRLCVHGMAAGILVLAGSADGLPLWWALLCGCLAVGLINVWNFMDGINGLAASQALLVACALVLLEPSLDRSLLALALAAACAGFLPFNFPRARIFLGDVGSGALGLLVAVMCAMAPVQVRSPAGAALVLLPLSAFLIDASLTLLSRIMRGEQWWTPHVQHAYQRCIQAGCGHPAVTAGYALWTLLSAVLAGVLMSASSTLVFGVCAAWYLSGSALWFLIQARCRKLATRRKEAT